MKDKIIELRRKLAALTLEERAQLDRMTTEGKTFDATETDQYERRAKDIGDVEAEIQKCEDFEKRDSGNREREERLSRLTTTPERPNGAAAAEKGEAEIRAAALVKYLRVGFRGLTEPETRALTVGTPTEGGYLRAPQQFYSGLIKNVDNEVFVRKLATVFSIGQAESLGAPTLDTDVDDASWTSELATGSEDTALRFGKRELRPHPLAKRIKVSKKMVSNPNFDVVSFIQMRLGYKFGVTYEKGYMTGSGAQQPLGVFVASTDGIPTTRDVSTGNSTTAIGADGLIEAKHAIKGAYWPALKWVFHRDALKGIRKLKDGSGQYLWQPDLTAGLAPKIIDTSYVISEYAPSTFTTGLYVGIIGDFSKYWIADANGMEIQALNELYAETNQVGYIARAESDGMPVLAEAFARVTLA